MTKDRMIECINSLDIPELTHGLNYVNPKKVIGLLGRGFFLENSRVVVLLKDYDRIRYYEGELYRYRNSTQRFKNTRKRKMIIECMDFLWVLMNILDSGGDRNLITTDHEICKKLEYAADFSRFLQEYEYIESNYPDKTREEKSKIYKDIKDTLDYPEDLDSLFKFLCDTAENTEKNKHKDFKALERTVIYRSYTDLRDWIGFSFNDNTPQENTRMWISEIERKADIGRGGRRIFPDGYLKTVNKMRDNNDEFKYNNMEKRSLIDSTDMIAFYYKTLLSVGGDKEVILTYGWDYIDAAIYIASVLMSHKDKLTEMQLNDVVKMNTLLNGIKEELGK